MGQRVDYNKCAESYDIRYEQYKYEGLKRYVLDFVEEDTTRRVLEVGCGTAFWLSLLHQKGFAVSGLDPSSEMLQRARTKVPEADTKQGSADSLPWPDSYFDRVICTYN